MIAWIQMMERTLEKGGSLFINFMLFNREFPLIMFSFYVVVFILAIFGTRYLSRNVVIGIPPFYTFIPILIAIFLFALFFTSFHPDLEERLVEREGQKRLAQQIK